MAPVDWTPGIRRHPAQRLDAARVQELQSLGGLVHRRCPSCDADDPEIIFREFATSPMQTWFSRDVFSVGDCRSCGFSYTIDVPSSDWFQRYHSPAHNPELRGSGKAAIDTYEHSAVFALPYYRVGLELLAGAGVQPGARILDVGCSEGYFLELASRSGYEAIGVDPVGSAVRSARQRGQQAYVGSASDAPVEVASLDAATLFDTIEHFSNPREVLTRIHRLLKPNGKIVITTPNFVEGLSRIRRSRGLTEPALFEYWCGSLHAWDHINFYTPSTLSRQLLSAGFLILSRVRRPIGLNLSLRSRISSYIRCISCYGSAGLIDRSVYQVVLAEKAQQCPAPARRQ